MGTTLSVTTGLGFAVPPAIVTAYEDAKDESFYDYLDDLIPDGGQLHFDMAAYYDYTPSEDDKPAYAVLLKSTVVVNYGAGVFPLGPTLTTGSDEELDAMFALVATLGIAGLSTKLEWLTVVSIG